MIKEIVFTTLSIGENYTKYYTLKFIEKVLFFTKHDVYITTDCPHIINEKFPNNLQVKINKIKREDIKLRINTDWGYGYGDDFNFNLKYLCFDIVKELENYVIIYTDCDNKLEWWDEEMVVNWLNNKINDGYDFFAPRNELKLYEFMNEYNSQNKKEYGLFWHKLYNYDLINNPKPEWGYSPLPAEYLLVFYNKERKLKLFYEKWKFFHDYLVKQNKSYGTWAEGFEIGVSSLYAKMKPYDIGWNHHLWFNIFNPNGNKLNYATER